MPLLRPHQVLGNPALPCLTPVPSGLRLRSTAIRRVAAAAALVAGDPALLNPCRDTVGSEVAVLRRGAAAGGVAPVDFVLAVVVTIPGMVGVGPAEFAG